MQHVIQRQTIEASTNDIESAKLVQQRVDILFKSQAIPMMDELFSSFSDDGSTIRIEKLELDLGNLSLHELDTQFTENLRAQLNKALIQVVQNLPKTHPKHPNHDEEKIFQNKGTSNLPLLIDYLQRGVLPWWASNSETFNLSTLVNKVLEETPDEFIQRLRQMVSIQYLERLVMQSNVSIHCLLFNILSTKSDANSAKIVEDWQRILKKTSIGNRQKAQIQTQLLYFILNPAKASSVEILSETIFQITQANTNSDKPGHVLKSFAINAQTSLAKSSEVALWIKQKIQKLMPEDTQLRSSDSAKTATPITSEESLTKKSQHRKSTPQETHLKESQLNENKTFNSPSPKKNEPEQSINTEQYIYIDNAGIVLLWPFLERYFKTLNVVKDKVFIDENAQEKSVLLLHYLLSGTTQAEEHTLLLCKLLCGWPIQQPLLRSIELSQQDKEESQELLLALIQHWKALKNTSIDGLRQSFLQREGRLTEKDHGWELLVNRTGYDVLLDQLPWGISTIHLPWMEKTVFVEW